MKSKEFTSVFVYGTLKPGGIYHDRFCSSFKFEAEEAYVNGKLFDFSPLGYPGALEGDDLRICGFVLRFSHKESEVLSKLDELKGYDPNRQEGLNEYYRKRVNVFKNAENSEASENAWCYFMALKKIESLRGVQMPDGFWPTKNPPT